MEENVALALDELSPEQRFTRDLASYSHEQDIMKHLATLSTGSIVLLATFLEKLFSHPSWRILVVIALVGFTASIIGTVVWQVLSLLHVSAVRSRRAGLVASRVSVPVIAAALGGFFIGVGALAVFAIRNILLG
jgi:hypothetical protein